MNNIPEDLWEIWDAGRFVGPDRPNTRATVSKNFLSSVSGTEWRTILFGQVNDWMEIPNIVTCEIDRRLGSDSATMRLTMKNAIPPDVMEELGPEGSQRRQSRDLGHPGYYSFRRGIARDSDGINPWGYDSNEWADVLIPNRMIRTFQGYGTDGAGNPANDERLVCTGFWLIDRVEFSAMGHITIECRDLAKLLIEQRLYPPIIPLDKYPLEFCADRMETQLVQTTVPGGQGPNVARRIPSGWDSSNAPWTGIGGSVYGHTAAHAFDGNDSTYWMTVGVSGPTVPWAFGWIGADTRGELVNRVRFRQRWGNYRVYIGVRVNGQWQGNNIVPYGYTTEPAYPNDSNRPYVLTQMTPPGDGWVTIDLPQMYRAEQVRITMTNFTNSGLGQYPYRAAIYEMQVFSYQETQTVEQEAEVLVEGNVVDYTDMIKIMCGWSGFFWPNQGQGQDWNDGVLARWTGSQVNGRIWGDFFVSGAYPVEPPCIPASFFDNMSVMDAINKIKEILGFIFMIDSHGGVQWRPPNIWRTGNFVKGRGYVGETSVRTVDEMKVLIDYGVTIDDQNLRSDIIAVSADDPSVHGSYQPGWSVDEGPAGTEISDLSLLAGQQRVMLVSNYPFGTSEDPQARAQIEKFAFLVSLWIHWTFRRSRFRIPGNPAFEVDDQVRIYERVTAETFVHYIEGYSSMMDLEAGTWHMDMDTHWLGNGPSSRWVIQAQDMHPALFAYLRSIGQIPSEIEDDQSRWPDSWYEYQPPNVPTAPIRVENDYSSLFPLPPGLAWPSGQISSEVPAGLTWVSPPTPGTPGTPGSPGAPANPGVTMNCSNEAAFAHWGGNCSAVPRRNLIMQQPPGLGVVKSHPDQTDTLVTTVHSLAAPAFEWLMLIVASEGMLLKLGQNGGYDCRRIRLTSGGFSDRWSNHSWGLAVDLNYRDLPQGRQAPAGHPVFRVAERAVALRTNNGRPIFRWGGAWSGTTVDPMHFEVCCTPQDIATGIDLGL